LKIFLITFLLLFSSSVTSNENIITKEPVTFEKFWKQSEQLKYKYSCSFDKERNSYFEFLFVVLGIENSTESKIQNTSILSDASRKLLESEVLDRVDFESQLPEVLCVTEKEALVLHHLKSPIKPNGFSFSVIWVSQYDFVKDKNNEIKLKIHENIENFSYRMSQQIDTHVFYKVKYEQAIPIE